MAITTYMGLTLPTISGDVNTWGAELNSNLSLLDQHDHSPGYGNQIPVAGLNIDDDLSFNNFGLNNVSQISLVPLPGGNTAANTLYVFNDNLWFNDAAGTPIQITNLGGVSSSPGSIAGLGSGDSIVLAHSTGILSFNWNSGSQNMILRAGTFWTTNDIRFGPTGSLQLAANGAKLIVSGTSTGSGLVEANSYYFGDSNSYINFDVPSNAYNFNSNGTPTALLKASGIRATGNVLIDSTATGTIVIGPVSAPNSADHITIQANSGFNNDSAIGASIRLLSNNNSSYSGVIQYYAYGQGVDSSNSHQFYVRAGINAASERIRIDARGLIFSGYSAILQEYPGSLLTLAIANTANQYRLPIVVSALTSNHGLVIVRGFVNSDGSVQAGEGFTVTKSGVGTYSISVTFPFFDLPVITATPYNSTSIITTPSNVSGNSFTISTGMNGTLVDASFTFIAIGQRST